MLTSASRRPLSRVPHDFKVEHRANGDFNVLTADRCEGCPTPARCAVDGCGKHTSRVLAYLKEVREAMPVIEGVPA